MRFAFSLIFLLIAYSLHSVDIHSTLQSLSEEERQDLQYVFSSLAKDFFTYTLFGDKPVSLTGRFTLTPWENTIEGLSSHGPFWKKWQTWERYKNLFSLKNYILIKEQSDNGNYKICNIILVNKKEFIKCVNNHKEFFQYKLNKQVSPEQMLNDIEQGKASFADTINHDEALLGILLGYGKHNAILYDKRERNSLMSLKIEPMDSGDNQLRRFGEYGYSPLIIEPVHFVADLTHPETRALQKKYQKLREKISKIYAQGDFLEITLLQLTLNK